MVRQRVHRYPAPVVPLGHAEVPDVPTPTCAAVICVCSPVFGRKAPKRGKTDATAPLGNWYQPPGKAGCKPLGNNQQPRQGAQLLAQTFFSWITGILGQIFLLTHACSQSTSLTSYFCKKHLHTNPVNKVSHAAVISVLNFTQQITNVRCKLFSQ